MLPLGSAVSSTVGRPSGPSGAARSCIGRENRAGQGSGAAGGRCERSRRPGGLASRVRLGARHRGSGGGQTQRSRSAAELEIAREHRFLDVPGSRRGGEVDVAACELTGPGPRGPRILLLGGRRPKHSCLTAQLLPAGIDRRADGSGCGHRRGGKTTHDRHAEHCRQQQDGLRGWSGRFGARCITPGVLGRPRTVTRVPGKARQLQDEDTLRTATAGTRRLPWGTGRWRVPAHSPR